MPVMLEMEVLACILNGSVHVSPRDWVLTGSVALWLRIEGLIRTILQMSSYEFPPASFLHPVSLAPYPTGASLKKHFGLCHSEMSRQVWS